MMERERLSIDRVFDMRAISLGNLSEEKQREALRILSALYLYDGVTFLENGETFPNSRINELMAFARGLFRHRIVALNLTDTYPQLSLRIDNKEIAGKAITLLIPENFVVRCQQYPTEQLGLVVKAASRIKDFLNVKFFPSEEVRQRAEAYLAEFLITRETLPPLFRPSLKEREALRSFPEGLDSLPGELFYEPISLSQVLLLPNTPHD